MKYFFNKNIIDINITTIDINITTIDINITTIENMSSTNSKIHNKLSTKDNKLFIFGYWFMKQMPPEIQKEYMSQFYCDGNVEKQTQTFEIFWNEFKETEKSLKNEIKNTKQKEPKEKKKRGRPRKEKKIVSCVCDNELLSMLIAEAHKDIQGPIYKESEKKIETDDEEEEDTICVQRFIYNNKQYLIDDNNNIYDEKSHEEIGIFNTKTNIIDFA